jgi:Abortive infection C-terminus
MNDPISKLRGLTSEIKAREDELRAYFTDLELRLKDAAGGYRIRGQSENCILETYGEDDAYYGYLYFDEDGLRVAYRTREEDTELAFSNEPWEPTYKFDTLDKCSAVWLRALSAPTVIQSLLTSINTRVEEELRATEAGIDALSATANLPLRDLDTGLVEAAKKLNFGAVIQHWQDAQAALGVDPPDATTRASSLIETLCKHILNAKGKPLPNNESIQHLYNTAARALSISPEQQITTDLKAIAGGMNTIVVGIGTLRTHAGTAHGKAPGSRPIDFPQARLAVNAAGVLATFLMDALIADGASSSGATP